ncbi:MAG: S-adenosylmethionine:tRNA ribosyltransferase-isomerase [Actinomycetota bacterium]
MLTERAFSLQDFELPLDLEAGEPPEARGLRRDDVRLLVSRMPDGSVEHARFTDLPSLLAPGDLLVVNASATIPASLPAVARDGRRFELHLSTRLPAELWSVELRVERAGGTDPWPGAHLGEVYELPAGGRVRLLAPYATGHAQSRRLWVARLDLPEGVDSYLAAHGAPIGYGPRRWPLATYQTIFATEPGSAEMPSAGRPFSPEVVSALEARAVRVASLVLHAGVSSPESHEPPFEEFFRVPDTTAALVNETRRAGGRVVAVGTTVVRALETVTDERGTAHPAEGWTSVVVTPERGVRSVDALLTGLHEPRSSHLLMLEAIASPCVLERAYDSALTNAYRWHEFGDLHLLWPVGRQGRMAGE